MTHYWLQPQLDCPVSGPYTHDEARERWDSGMWMWPNEKMFYGPSERDLSFVHIVAVDVGHDYPSGFGMTCWTYVGQSPTLESHCVNWIELPANYYRRLTEMVAVFESGTDDQFSEPMTRAEARRWLADAESSEDEFFSSRVFCIRTV